jgi:hypothetical protein
MKKPTDAEFAKVILEAIKDEPYFNEEILIPKITVLVKLFRKNTDERNFQKALSEKAINNTVLKNMKLIDEIKFWKKIVRSKSTDLEMQNYYHIQEEIQNSTYETNL